MTPDQLRGVTTVGKSLLLSAAAGSGKTRVLAERCAYLVCDAPEPFRCNVDELLVVTFTEAAAGEMRDRIGRVLSARLRDGSDDRLTEQLALLEQAQISTLHGFCAYLLRQHFHVIGLDPGFSVMDQHESQLLRLDVCRELFRQRYATDTTGVFQRMVDGYAEGNDERLVAEVLQVHALLGSVKNPERWKNAVRSRLDRATRGKFSVSVMGQKLRDLVKHSIVAMGERCNDTLELLKLYPNPKFKPYHDRASELLSTLRLCYKEIDRNGLDAISEIVFNDDGKVKLPALKAVPSDVPHKELVKGAIDALNNEYKSGSWLRFLRFTEAEWQEGLKKIQPHVEELIALVDAFDTEYEAQKTAARQVDFNDLERYALRILRDPNRQGFWPSSVARYYHHAFKQVLVDEYQDINEIQAAIIRLISRDCLYSQDDESAPEAKTLPAEPDISRLADLPPNLFCVGDVKQSIYRFRLADVQQFMDREELLRKSPAGLGEVIDLKQNFRSRGPLLQAINAVFRRLMTKEGAEIQYDQRHELAPGREFPDAGDKPVFTGWPIELHLLATEGEDDDETSSEEPGRRNERGASTPVSERSSEDPDRSREESGSSRVRSGPGVAANSEDAPSATPDRTEREAAFVGKRIRQILGLDGGKRMFVTDRIRETGEERQELRPAEFRDIVILLRSKKYKAQQYVRVLEAMGVPTHVDSGDGFFGSTEIRDIVSLLCLLDNQQQDLELAAYLRSPLAGLKHPEDALAAVRIAYRAEMTGDKPRTIPFHAAVVRYATEKSDELGRQLKEILDRLEELRKQANYQPVHETLWQIYQETGYLAYVSGLPGGRQRTANLMDLYERARTFATHRRQGLGRFLDLLKTLEAETDVGTPSVLSEADNVVRIQTVHAAKGLEYPIVFLPDCGRKFNRRDEYGSILFDRKMGIGLAVVDEALYAQYPSLAQLLVKDNLHRRALAEELRVVYVAMTRAMEQLILVGSVKGDPREGWKNQWSSLAGALPPNDFLEANTLLDWLGPVWAAEQAGGAKGAIELTMEPPVELNLGRSGRSEAELPAELKALCERKPIAASSEPTEAAKTVIERMSFEYPFEVATWQMASKSVTSIAKQPGASAPEVRVEPTEFATPVSERTRKDPDAWREESGSSRVRSDTGVGTLQLTSPDELALPVFMSDEPQTLAATERGQATHLALQYLRFAAATDAAAIASQLDRMEKERQLKKIQRESVDIAAIEWFLGTPLGKQVTENEPRLMRELPVYFTAPPTADSVPDAGGLDLTMVRGRLDLLVPLPTGGVLVDYKTDNVRTDEQIADRVAIYREQLKLYAEALERITGQTVQRRCLVFLAARRVVEV